MLLYLVSVGLVAVSIIGAFFGTGFFLLASPASKTIADFDRNPPRAYGNAPKASREAVLVSRETGMPHSAAVGVLPGSPLSQRPPADEAAPPQQSKAVQDFPPTSANGEPPAEAASVPEPASSSAASPPSPMPLASLPPFAAEDAVLPAGAKSHLARYGRSAHSRTASQHSRPHAARSVPTLTPPQSPFATKASIRLRP